MDPLDKQYRDAVKWAMRDIDHYKALRKGHEERYREGTRLARARIEAMQRLSDITKIAPQQVDTIQKAIIREHPDYNESRAWSIAWSQFCKDNPDSGHCHKD